MRLRPGAVEWRAVEGEIVALDVPGSSYLAVNATGAALWPLLESGSTTQELAATLTSRYGISDEQSAHDVADFLQVLRGRGLLEDIETA